MLQILLILANVELRFTMRELNLFCYRTNWTPVLCYSAQEAAEFLESLYFAKSKNEQNALKAIQERKKKQLGVMPEQEIEMKQVSFNTFEFS